MAHTKGNWTIGKFGGSVVTDIIPEDYKTGSGHDATDYYGGFLIAESIRDQDKKLIAAAPDLLEACKQLIDAPHFEHFAARLNNQEMKGIEMIKVAIKKATE